MKQQLQSAIQYTLDQAKVMGATDCEVMISAGEGFSTCVRMGEVDTIEHYQDQQAGVTVYFGQRKGVATTTDLHHDALKRTLQAACDIAKFTVQDPCAGLPDKSDLETDIRNLDLYHPWHIQVDEAIEWCQRCEKIAMDADPRITNSDGANLVTYNGWRALGNSHGFLDAYPTSKHSYNVCVIATENGQMQRDYGYSNARHPDQLWDIEKVAREAADKTLQRLSPRKIETGQYPVIFNAAEAAGLIGVFLNAIKGGQLYRESTFLLDKLDQSIFPDFLTIHEDPFVSQALGSSPYDAEGVKQHKRDLVKNGVLQGYQLSSYSARKLGMQTTGNAGGSHSILVSHSNQTQQDLMKQMGTGLLVTDLIGQGVDLVTGNYSRGASGLWVENGEIQFPVEEITLASNLADMFKDIAVIANDADQRNTIHTGSILLNQMTVAG